jgi:cytochrome c oxidase cbb3-type subunit 4
MDLNDARVVLTLLGFIGFIAIVAWAYSKTARKGFKEASELPFADEPDAKRSGEHGKDK